MKSILKAGALLGLLFSTNILSAQTSNCNGYLPYISSQQYDGTNYVVFNNALYKANNWVGQNTPPITTNVGAGLSWTLVNASCPSPITYYTEPCNTYPTYTSFAGSNPQGPNSGGIVITDDSKQFVYKSRWGGSLTPPQTNTNNIWQVQAQCAVPSTINITSAFTTFTAPVGEVSASQSFSINATNLTGPITITPPVGFKVGWNENDANFSSNPITVNPALDATIDNRTMWLIFTPNSAGIENGNITISGGGITTRTIPVSGTATPVTPWSIDGNGNTKAANFLGNKTNFPLILKANNIEGFRVNTTGGASVGIPYSPGYYKFEVNGGLTALTGPNTANQNNLLVLYSGNQSTTSAGLGFKHYTGFSHGNWITGTAPSLVTTEYGIINSYEYNNTGSGTGRGKHLLLQNTPEGNLGVGIFGNAPTAKLHVKGTSAFEGLTSITASVSQGNDALKLISPTPSITNGGASHYVFIGNRVFSGGEQFGIIGAYEENATTLAGNAKHLIIQGQANGVGNLGIGYFATPPTEKLQVQGKIKASGDIIFNGNTSLTTALTTAGLWQKSGTSITYIGGNVGIGVTSADSPLTVANGISVVGPGNGDEGGQINLADPSTTVGGETNAWAIDNFKGDLRFFHQGATDRFIRMNNKLSAKEVFVTASPLTDNFPDYVFDKSYKLMPLDSVAMFIEVNKHLPEVPSAKEVQAAKQISLGEMNNLLLKKVEELTLYLIEQQKAMQEQQKQNASIQKQNEFMQKQIDELKKVQSTK